MTRYYELNFIRKPEFMGFNGYNDGINRTAFNPFAWEIRQLHKRRLFDQEMSPYITPSRRLLLIKTLPGYSLASS